MRKAAIILCCFLLLSQLGRAQFVVKGVVSDTLNFKQLRYASVVLMRASDSVIETFGRSSYDGTFKLTVAKEGKYLFRVTFPGFADYVDVVTVKSPLTDLGTLPLLSKEHLLKEFVVTRQIAAIKIKGDTTEYVADSFKTKENASVENLLKKLPGIQVDKDGKITAQGETVTKVLVDGEEFFSDDPKVVTQGLQAVAVDKVQVFDKKSEQAEFTGIDDGQKTKTINLQLKENMKKGYFGKLDAAAGTDGYYQEQGMINAFKAKRQISAFAITSNTDKAGLGWNDNSKFGGGGENTTITDDGSAYTTFSSSGDFAGWDGKYNGEGLPRTNTGGIHYANKWDEDKNHVSGNYRYGSQGVDIGGNTTTQYILPGNKGSLQTDNKTQSSMGYRHSADALFERKLDSNTTIKVACDGGVKHTEIASVFVDSTINSENFFVNNNNRTINSKTNGDYFNSSLIFKKKFKKKGRTLSVDVKENYFDSKTDGSLTSTLVYYDTTTKKDSTTRTNQIKESNGGKLAFSAKVTYTEPLSKVWFLDLSYQGAVNNSTSANSSFDSANGKVSGTLDSVYSSNFQYNIVTNRGGLYFKYDDKKFSASIGSDVSDTRYHQTDILHYNKVYDRDYLNLFPSMYFQYKIKKQTRISWSYRGYSQQPTIDQVAPLRQNTDPLNITIGNPNLKQSFTHKGSVSFNDYKVLSGRYTYCQVEFSAVKDAISASQTLAPTGNTTQYININGNYSCNYYANRGAKIKKTNLYVGVNTSGNISHNHNFVNGVANVSDNNNYNIGSYISYSKENKYDFEVNPSYSYTDNKSTISTYSNSYYLYNIDLSGSVQITKKFEIGSSFDIIERQKTTAFSTNNHILKWNAYLSHKLLKNNQLELRLAVFDILNQNIGYTRTAENGVVTATSYNTIRRYGMLYANWNFSYKPGAAATDDDEE